MNISHHFFNWFRNLIPLSVRKMIGPTLAEVSYQKRLLLANSTNRPKVLSITETIDTIKHQRLSALRFGDGELTLMEGKPLLFQEHDDRLVTKLQFILSHPDPKILLCIPDFWGRLDHFESFAQRFIKHHLFHYTYLWQKLLKDDVTYGDAYFSRPYLGYKDKTNAAEIFQKIKTLWKNRDIILIEGEKSRLGVGNDLFANAASIKRILAPAEHAFRKYLDILTEAKKTPNDSLILLSLGPTAKILGYELAKCNYQAIDIGHIDMEYEMFLRHSPKLVKVPYKYFNEINERDPEECLDAEYQRQIISRII